MIQIDQQGDVLLFQTIDDGDINVIRGLVQMTGGFETMTYLCLFGGNETDDGSDSSSEGWWANLNENENQFKLVSETQNLLLSLPTTSANLLRIEEAAKRDLNVFLEQNIASSIEVSASIPGLNQVKVVVDIEAFGEESSFEFVENWKSIL